ncbi:recombinase family protein [Clostridium baratii]|uniref:DNA-invertase Hin n=1 Tax=Clostridium baratii TaxID=1561 RepID=A0A174VEX2_9CLOT|nr:recombinase family protein [Clostridium baratii]CUQ30530.1 DNA-invertase Hin [Clostridium baratii]
MIYGYARISSKSQLTGNSLEEQICILSNNGCEKIIEEVFTGTKSDRPRFKLLLNELKNGDTLVVTKLDRFARSVIEGSKIINDLIERGIKVNILNIGILDNTPSSKLIRNIFFSFAEFERDMIIERTQEGKSIAKTKEGFKEGRPKKYTEKQLNHALSLLNTNGGNHSYKEVTEITGISKSTLIREVNKNRKTIY